MKKALILLIVTMLSLSVFTAEAAPSNSGGRGGIMGLIAGCCFGIRAAGDYNSGKEISWREWVRIVPYVNIIFAIWDGVDGAGGVTTADLASEYGSVYY